MHLGLECLHVPKLVEEVDCISVADLGGVVQGVRTPPKAAIYFNIKLLIHVQGPIIKSGRTPPFAELQIRPCILHWNNDSVYNSVNRRISQRHKLHVLLIVLSLF